MWARAAALGVAASGMCLIGCALPKPPPETAPGGFAGAAATFSVRMGKHAVVFECPTPGWVAAFDQFRDAPEGWTHAFITLRRPSPVFVYPQVVTHQEVLLDVPTSRSVRVFARVLDHDAEAEGAYHQVGEVAGK